MITAEHSRSITHEPASDAENPWTRVLLWAVGISAAADIALMALLSAVIPPVVVGVVVSLIGIALLRRRPRAGVILLGVVSALMVVTSAPFAAPHLSHPESPLDFVHAVIHLGGRLVAVAAAIAIWRSASPTTARPAGRLAAGLLLTTVVVSAVAAVSTNRDTARPGDVTVPVRDWEFPPEVRVASGDTVFVDNDDLTRHTFTVKGTDVSRQIAPRTGVRFAVELEPGTYRLFCAIPGHESMTASLIVQ